jgi:hypothetical protein
MISKSLAAAVTLLTVAGAAQAQLFTGASENVQRLQRCADALGVSVGECQAREFAASGADAKYLARILGPAQATTAAPEVLIDPALYGGLPDAADPDELRRQRERGKREDEAVARRGR